MVIPGATQALTASFTFGILLQAATGALLIYFKGHAKTIFKDGRRLVLLLFLLSSTIWALLGFANLMIITPVACQATLIFSTAFDQGARVAVEQFLLWSVGQGTKVTAGRLILQAVLGLRLIAGGVVVGFTRPDFAPVCVARASVLPVAIVVLALDILIIGALIIQALSLGMFGDLRKGGSSTHKEQSKALILILLGLTMWTATSVPMILGIPTTMLLVRTTIPTIGLLALVGIVALFSVYLLEPREEATTPEAKSPFMAPMPSSRELSRGNIGNGSPIPSHNYSKSGSLFVVNPSSPSPPRDSSTTLFQGNRGYSKFGRESIARVLDVGSSDQPQSGDGPGYRGSSGVFPSILTRSMVMDQGAVAPYIITDAVDSNRNIPALTAPAPVSQQKRGLFGWPKQSVKPTIRSLGISRPVMSEEENSSAQPFARIQTIDLATAAVNERERREAAVAKARLMANRLTPQQPSFTANEGLRKSSSVKRKQIPVRLTAPLSTIASSSASRLSIDAINGSTSSASLSPAREEVRRRSPRNANTFDQSVNEKVKSIPTLQRNQSVGLPSNPRATRIAPARPSRGPVMAKEQSVMFLNDIVYDNPGIVKTIIKEAPKMYASAKRANHSEKAPATSYSTNLTSSGSIIHRPRPYRRDSEKERPLFPSQQSPLHRRSKSGSSITTRKSIYMSQPGSPTLLPPLPAPPTSASKLIRLLPNDTKSMTFDEKIQLLFPAPPGATLIRNRRSSVPSLPRVPSVFMADTPQMQSPTEIHHRSRRASERTTIASFEIPDVQIETVKEAPSKPARRQTIRFSVNTYRAPADEVGETWIPGIPTEGDNVGNPLQQSSKQDSNVQYDVRKSVWTDASSSNASTLDDSTTFWGSIHSEIPPVDLSKALRKANSTFIQRTDVRSQKDNSEARPPVPQLVSPDEGEIMTIMLESEENSGSVLSTTEDNRRSFINADQALPGDKTPNLPSGRSWHRRIGDELPTFSERKNSPRSRKMPPPTPLLLNQRGRGATVVIRGALPSPPAIDSPQRVIAEIQAQLKRFENPGRGSVGSLLLHIPDANSRGDAIVNEGDEDRFRLLENLESEMGQQENQWQQMQTNLDRDSLSSIVTPQVPTPSDSDMSRDSSRRSSRTPSRVVSRRARVSRSMTLRSKEDDSTCTTSTQSSDNSRASIWQQRLAEAQMEYMEHAPALLHKRSLNFLSVSNSHQLGSPTPPESVESGTDLETDSEMESESEQVSNESRKEVASLWKQQLSSPRAASGRMWNPPYQTTVCTASPEPPAKYIRPAQRRAEQSLPISSSMLWSKPASSGNSRPVVGLWGSRSVRPKSIVTRPTRPVTQRPPRKSKRVTFLPDIVESPLPLPNKRDTLGIFQFPWGETSDSAIYQPAFNPALLSGPILNAKLDARSRQLEPESEYSSSFFDDYDDDMDYDDYLDSESDDDFDETTLWEIASMLKSENVPSRDSLLPAPREVIEDYDEETDIESGSDVGVVDVAGSSKIIQGSVVKLPIMPLAMTFKGESKEESTLWTSRPTSASIALPTGLPQPVSSVWQAYTPSPNDILRPKPRASEALPTLASSKMWTISQSATSNATASPMWSRSDTAKTTCAASSTPNAMSKFMWVLQPKEVNEEHFGLFSVDVQRSEFRTTQEIPAVGRIGRSPRPSNAPLSSLASQSLWSPGHRVSRATVWISKSITRSSTADATQHVVQMRGMWTAIEKAETVTILGLFVKSPSRFDYRRTDLLPAALHMNVKHRITIAPLNQLTSHTLWNGEEKLPYEHHWISESSIRPSSPSVYSESSSGRSSPVSDTDSSSVKSTSTKASSFWGSISSIKTGAWWEPRTSKGKTSPSPPPVDNSKFSSKVPIQQSSAMGLAPLRESRVLASRDLWETMGSALSDTPKRKVHKERVSQKLIEEVQQPLKQHAPVVAVETNGGEELAEAAVARTPKETLSRPTVTPAEWDAALARAISESRPRLQRPNASSAMWQAALKEAVDKSTIPLTLRYDAAVRHPVFFTESLVSTAADVHPAAIGYVNLPSYDAAVRHPVFFTESLISNVADVHPAAIGHVVRPQPQSSRMDYMWTAATKTVSSGGFNPEQPDMFSHLKTDSSRRNAIRPTALPRLHSSELFQPAPASSKETDLNWLNATASLSKLVSKATSAPVAPKAKTVRFAVVPAQTWTPPSSSVFSTEPQTSNIMWASHPRSGEEVQDRTMFSNPHTEPWTRVKRGDDTHAKELESRSMWRRSRVMPESPKHWLKCGEKTVNKVIFRY